MHTHITRGIQIRTRGAVLLLLTLCAPLLITPLIASAAPTSPLSVTPVVIDEKAKARDILNESITLTNTGSYTLEVYPSVNDVQDAAGTQGFSYAQSSAGLSDSLSNWIELSRGVITLGPGERKIIPFVITVNLNAVPNAYHALITFTQGNTRDEATASAPLATVTVNLEVATNAKEEMQLQKFSADNIVFTGDDVLFNYNLQNIGNQDLQPTGEINIYDRNGQEVATVNVNKEGKNVAPNETAQLASSWSAVRGFGQFKALLTVHYGSQNAAVQDTIYFWIIPWVQILEVLGASLIAIIILSLYFQRWLESRHLTRLAAAGALKPGVLEQIQSTPPPPLITVPSLPSIPMPPMPPVAEIKERVQAQVRHRRTLFNMFKRRGFVSIPDAPKDSVISPHAATETPRSSIASTGTIDLKHMRISTPVTPPVESHIINLKKNS